MNGMPTELIMAIVGLFAAVLAILNKVLNHVFPSRIEKLMLSMSKQIDELHKAHLGPAAMDTNGRWRWLTPTELVPTLKSMDCTLGSMLEKLDVTSELAHAHSRQADAVELMAKAAIQNMQREAKEA